MWLSVIFAKYLRIFVTFDDRYMLNGWITYEMQINSAMIRQNDVFLTCFIRTFAVDLNNVFQWFFRFQNITGFFGCVTRTWYHKNKSLISKIHILRVHWKSIKIREGLNSWEWRYLLEIWMGGFKIAWAFHGSGAIFFLISVPVLQSTFDLVKLYM